MNQNNLPASFTKAVPLAIGWSFICFWALQIFRQQHNFIADNLDLPIMMLFIIAGLVKRNFSPFLPAFYLLSYEIHAQAALRVENFQVFYVASWLVCAWLLYRQPDRAGSLVIYHAGLSFDPGSAVTLGVGMQAGLSAAPVTVLFLAFFVRELWNNRIDFAANTGHFLVVSGLAWLAMNHYHGIAADLTAQFVAFSAAAILFFAICSESSDPQQQPRHVNAIMAGGFLIVAAALTNQALESASIGEFFSRRAWAGALHPNHIATWCLAMIWALVISNRKNPEHHLARRVFFIALFFLMILVSGARLIMAITIVGLSLQYLLYAGKPEKNEKKASSNPWYLNQRHLLYAISGFLIVIFAARFLYKFDLNEFAHNERIYIWKAAIGLISQSPFTGYGVLQFALLPQQIDSAGASWVYDWNYPHTHQILLEMLLWGGIPLLIIFVAGWLHACRFWYASGLCLAILSVTATVVADFTWRTPAMILMAIFYLLPTRQPAGASRILPFYFKASISVATALVVVWLTSIHSGFSAYGQAMNHLTTGRGDWKAEINTAVARLPFSADIRMQRLLLHLAREKMDSDFTSQLADLRIKFPEFWPALFIEARKAELAGDRHMALQLYLRTLEFEGADLSGIRCARAAILAMQLGDAAVERLTADTFARGQWGAAMLANHPDYGEKFREIARTQALKPVIDDFFSAVRQARIIKNLAGNIINVPEESLKKLENFSLPAWLIDEMVGACRLSRAEEIARKYLEVDYALTGRLKPRLLTPADRNEIDNLAEELRQYGSACLRTLAWIRLEQADHGGFIAAYDQMLQRYNFRSKNYEDLSGQFLFARFAFQAGEYNQSIDMLQKLSAFDAGCPFISRLMANCHTALGKPEDAAFYRKLARQQVSYARFDPFYREEPRMLLWPQGDQWIFLFEKLLRRFDPDAAGYCKNDWENFLTSLE